MGSKLKKVVAASLSAVLLTGGIAQGNQGQSVINVVYDNIKIIIDGVEYTPRDANGAVVEPFIYNGTTYLPVRGVAGAFGKEEEWDPQSSTVYLGDRDFDWLDQMAYVDYKTTSLNDKLSTIKDGTKAVDGIRYDRGIRFDNAMKNVKKLNDGTYESYQEVSYLLNMQYKTFNGVFTVFANNSDYHGIIRMYGDDELIYTSPPLADGTKSTDFSVDVSDYKILKIKFEVVNAKTAGVVDYSDQVCVGLADARLSKSY